jgi:hypothetical protein
MIFSVWIASAFQWINRLAKQRQALTDSAQELTPESLPYLTPRRVQKETKIGGNMRLGYSEKFALLNQKTKI